MKRIDTIIIGGGQAGLAMSRCLSDRMVDHVVLERGRIAERWRSERWDSLHLLTPNWQTRLPSFQYNGLDPDGFMGMASLVAFFEEYAVSFGAPVETQVTVTSLERAGDGFVVRTTRGQWSARNVVIATGFSDTPFVPRDASRLDPSILQVVPTQYRRPDQLPEGGVLVVGASATGIQLADEIHASGRPVTLAAGRHLRLPRSYRGRDILWWLDALGILRESTDTVADIRASRTQPSLQLIGRSDGSSADLGSLRYRGVRILGRLVHMEGERVAFDDDLVATTVASDLKLADLLRRIDRFIIQRGLSASVEFAPPFVPAWPAAMQTGKAVLDLRSAGIQTIVWATGFQRRYPWLRIPVLDDAGEIRHRGGITAEPGLFVLGMHFQRRRNSAFIDGVGDDAAFLAEQIATRPDATAALKGCASNPAKSTGRACSAALQGCQHA